jgi:hypothetical protein
VLTVPRQSKTTFTALWLVLIPVAQAQADLIANGGFEAGNSGFTSNYVYSPGNLTPPRTFAVVTDPALAFPGGGAASYGDHTTGSGEMLAVHGSTNLANPDVLVWGQIAAVVPNSTYTFSMFISSWHAGPPGQLDISLNGTSLGTVTAPDATGVWVPFSATWNSGSAKSAVIELWGKSTSSGGNGFSGFALDDFGFKGPDPFATPEPACVVHLLSSALALGLGNLARRYRHRRS